MKEKFPIIYLDNHLLIADKPAGMLTQETEKEKHSLENAAKAFLKEKFQKKGNVFLGVVHRLDKDVSGLVVFARTSKALSRLNQIFRSRQLQKVYLAVIEGTLPKRSGYLEDLLGKESHKARITKDKDEMGKKAILFYEVIKEKNKKSLLRIFLKTGRYHQIRIQFSSRGHPIVGDQKYGSRVFWPEKGIALHHWKIEFIHPVKKEWLTVQSKKSFHIV
ncbi:MAG: RluA family pseudouridine synthase [Simkaniaceae bacterium]